MANQGDGEGMSPNVMLAIGLVVCGVLVVGALLGSRFLKTTPPPPPPPVAQQAAQSVNTTLKFSTGYYQATVEEDAKKLKLKAPTADALAAPLPYADELAAPRAMKPEKDTLETPHLRISTSISKEWSATGTAQRMRVDHLMLTISNKSDRPVAYRVDTKLPDTARCKNKGELVQNAIALKPGETVHRTECMFGKGVSLRVDKVEVIELTDLGYFYTSRLTPGQVLLDERATAGHEAPNKLKPCTFVPWREIKSASETKGGVEWADVLDFYARHNCDEYTFFPAYRRWTSPGALPSHPTTAAP